MKKDLKEELTTAMHGDFNISAEKELKHTCYAALGCISDGMQLENAMSIYKLSKDDLKSNLSEFNKLFAKNVVLEN